MTSERDLSRFWCWHIDAQIMARNVLGILLLRNFMEKNNTALLKCRTCGHCFSETRGTPFFGLTTPWNEVVRTLAQIPEKGSIRGVARSSITIPN